MFTLRYFHHPPQLQKFHHEAVTDYESFPILRVSHNSKAHAVDSVSAGQQSRETYLTPW